MSDAAFWRCTGKSVRVGIVDTGVDPSHPDVGRLDGGTEIVVGAGGNACFLDGYDRDPVGHGTACAAIIRKKAPDALIYSIKILGSDLSADVRALVAALRWASANEIKLVNLSLGIVDKRHFSMLASLCEELAATGIVLVAAGYGDDRTVYPAVLPSVIGVSAGFATYVHHANRPVEFSARGDQQRIAWRDSRLVFLGGISFAVAHISGVAALILEDQPGLGIDGVREALICGASREEPDTAPRLYSGYVTSIREPESNGAMSLPLPETGRHSWISKAALYPFNKEMHAFLRFPDLLGFEVTGVADAIGKGLAGRDAGGAIGCPDSGLRIVTNVGKACIGADTLILGHLEHLSAISGRDLTFEIVEKILRQGLSIFSLTPLVGERYDRLFESCARQGARISYPLISLEDVVSQVQGQPGKVKKTKAPVVGVFGTSPDQGKLTTQLALRRQLLKEGYSVAQISTEPHGGLFGCDFVFPYGYSSAVAIPMDLYAAYLEARVYEIDRNRNPDIIVVGAQSGTIPFDFSLPYPNHSLPTIAFLLGTRPDAYILAVNSFDPYDYVQDTMNALSALGKGKVILMTVSHREKDSRDMFGGRRMSTRILSQEELVKKISAIEEHFGIPVTEVTSDVGQRKLHDVVVDYFASE